MRKPPKNETLSEALRRFIRAEVGDGSLRELARDAGVDHAVLSRFVAGKRSVTLETADRVAGALRVRLVAGR